jgi:hypothetical protein
MLTTTVDADLKRRVVALANAIPGGTISGVLEEVLKAALPLLEVATKAFQDARKSDGTVDEAVLQQQLGQWIGVQMLKMYSTNEADRTIGGHDRVGAKERPRRC